MELPWTGREMCGLHTIRRIAIAKLSNTGAILSGTGFTGGKLASPYAVAIDVSGNAWVANNSGISVTEFTV